MTAKEDAWTRLDTYLGRLLRRLGGDGYVFLDGEGVRLPFVGESVHLIEEFRAAKAALCATYKGDRPGLPVGAIPRHFHPDAKNCFVAEPILSTHLLLVVFTDKFKRGGPPEAVDVFQTLDLANSRLCALIRRLPPDDDGDRPPAVALRMLGS
jgi:hypothetical protein